MPWGLRQSTFLLPDFLTLGNRNPQRGAGTCCQPQTAGEGRNCISLCPSVGSTLLAPRLAQAEWGRQLCDKSMVQTGCLGTLLSLWGVVVSQAVSLAARPTQLVSALRSCLAFTCCVCCLCSANLSVARSSQRQVLEDFTVSQYH